MDQKKKSNEAKLTSDADTLAEALADGCDEDKEAAGRDSEALS
jgi:hypothetical protein